MRKKSRINPDHIETLKNVINEGPFFRLLSLEICDIKPGTSRVEVQLNTDHHNLFGNVHGGVYATLIDVASYWSAYCDLDENTGTTTIDLHIDYLSAVKSGRLRVEGQLIKAGRKVCFTRATIYDSNDNILAIGTSKLIISEGVRSIEKYLEDGGRPPLPSKFIG